jgi:hypothetical protein
MSLAQCYFEAYLKVKPNCCPFYYTVFKKIKCLFFFIVGGSKRKAESPEPEETESIKPLQLPSGWDEAVFRDLPVELQRELLDSSSSQSQNLGLSQQNELLNSSSSQSQNYKSSQQKEFFSSSQKSQTSQAKKKPKSGNNILNYFGKKS